MNFLHGVPIVCASALISFSFHALNSDLSDPSVFSAAMLLLSLMDFLDCTGLVVIVAIWLAMSCCMATTISTVLETLLVNCVTCVEKVSGSVPTSDRLAAIRWCSSSSDLTSPVRTGMSAVIAQFVATALSLPCREAVCLP